MKRYKTEFKLEVVESFLAGEGGAKLLARRWSVSESKIRTWVSHYRVHGIDGLRPKRSAYSTQFKQQVLSHQDREKLSSRRNLDQDGRLSLGSEKEGHPNMKRERRCAEPSSIATPDPTQALREENERLRAEVAYLKKLQALIRSKRSAAPTKRV